MVVNFSGNSTVSKKNECSNILSEIYVRQSGSTTFSKSVYEKTPIPISVTISGTTTLIMLELLNA